MLFSDGSIVDGADWSGLTSKLNLHSNPDHNHYRVVVIGGGPAGAQAAITAASELSPGERVSMIADRFGGQASYTTSVKNVMGFPDVTGKELMVRGLEGAKLRGAELIHNRVDSIEERDGKKVLRLRDGSEITSDAVVVATGMTYNRLDVPGVDKLEHSGVFTLADARETHVMRGKNVAIVGAGNSAGQAAVGFAQHAKHVELLVRGPNLGRTMSQYLVDEIQRRPNIHVLLQTEVKGVYGVDRLEGMQVTRRFPSIAAHGNGTGESAGDGTAVSYLPVDAMYVYIGGRPNTSFLNRSGVALDDKGFVRTGYDAQAESGFVPRRPLLPYETSMPGVFAVGDVHAGSPQKRIASAIGDGAKFAGSLHTYLSLMPVSETVPILPAAAQTGDRWAHLKIKLPTLVSGLLRPVDNRLFLGI